MGDPVQGDYTPFLPAPDRPFLIPAPAGITAYAGRPYNRRKPPSRPLSGCPGAISTAAACWKCGSKHTPRERCPYCGAGDLAAWTPPSPDWEAPLTKTELKELRKGRRYRRVIPDEEVWAMRRRFRAAGLSMAAFCRREELANRAHIADTLLGRERYEGV